MRVREAMHSEDDLPVAPVDAVFREVLEEMDRKRLGAVCIEAYGRLVGIVTDGDVRRLLLSTQKTLPELFMESVDVVMTRDPKAIDADASLDEALAEFERLEVWVLPVIESGRLVGLLHLHALLKAMLGDR